MKLGTDTHGPQRMHPNDLLTFHLAPPAGQGFLVIQGNVLTSACWIGTKFCADIGFPDNVS